MAKKILSHSLTNPWNLHHYCSLKEALGSHFCWSKWLSKFKRDRSACLYFVCFYLKTCIILHSIHRMWTKVTQRHPILFSFPIYLEVASSLFLTSKFLKHTYFLLMSNVIQLQPTEVLYQNFPWFCDLTIWKSLNATTKSCTGPILCHQFLFINLFEPHAVFHFTWQKSSFT